jgi:hypothetical protein
MVVIGSEAPLWVSVPVVSMPTFIGTRDSDPYGHTFYNYFVGTSIDSLTPVVVIDQDAPEIAYAVSERLLPFVHPDALMPFVQTAKLRLLSFGLARREHVILTRDDPASRWWLYSPIAEVNKFVVDGVYYEATVINGDIYIGSDKVTQLDGNGRAVFLIPAELVEVHYAISTISPIVNEALQYFTAAAYLRAASDQQSGIYESIRVGAVTFSFRTVKELKDKAQQLERLGFQLLKVGGRL